MSGFVRVNPIEQAVADVTIAMVGIDAVAAVADLSMGPATAVAVLRGQAMEAAIRNDKVAATFLLQFADAVQAFNPLGYVSTADKIAALVARVAILEAAR